MGANLAIVTAIRISSVIFWFATSPRTRTNISCQHEYIYDFIIDVKADL